MAKAITLRMQAMRGDTTVCLHRASAESDVWGPNADGVSDGCSSSTRSWMFNYCTSMSGCFEQCHWDRLTLISEAILLAINCNLET